MLAVGGCLCHFEVFFCLDSGCEISLIDFEEFRSCCLLSRSVRFAFCYHRGYFCIWAVLVGCFVTFSGLEWSTYNSREDRFQSTLPLTYLRRTTEQRRQIPVSTYDIRAKHGLCADISGVALDIEERRFIFIS